MKKSVRNYVTEIISKDIDRIDHEIEAYNSGIDYHCKLVKEARKSIDANNVMREKYIEAIIELEAGNG